MRSAAKFILSREVMREQYERIAQVVDIVSYSAKTNYVVAKEMQALTSCMFNIHSLAGLAEIQDATRVWYFGQAWDAQELQEVFARGVTKFVIDNENDLQTLLDFCSKNNKKIELLLRMRLQENTIHTGKYFVYGLRAKRVNELIAQLKDTVCISALGVHFHRKSQNISEWSLKYELEQILTKETLATIKYLNCGGGFPVSYKNFKAQVIAAIFKEVAELKIWLNAQNITLIAEPGRFIAAPCVKLVANVVNKYDDTLIIDCSVFNTALDTFVVHHKLLIEGEQENSLVQQDGVTYTIKGITPDSMDLFRYRVVLEEKQIGDTITFMNAGAYNFTSDFCKLPKLPTEVVDKW